MVAQEWWFDRISESIARVHLNPNVKNVAQFGENLDISGTEDVWPNGATYPFPAAAGTLSVVSASAEDDTGGTGATQIKIYGLDANYDEINEVVTLDGTTPVVTTASFLRVNRMHIVGTVGTALTNLGDITATHGVAGVIGIIPAGLGQTQQAIYTVPRGYSGFLQNVHAHIEGTSSATIAIRAYRRINLGDDASGWRGVRLGTVRTADSYEDIIMNAGTSITGGDDIRIAGTVVSGSNVEISASFDIVLFAD